MKFRTITEEYETPHTIDGRTVMVTKERQRHVPDLPRDLDAIAVQVTSGLVLALTVVAVAWSTWSIGELLGGGIGYAAAAVFDLGWVVAILLEWMARYDKEKRRFPRRLGWALLLGTMGAILWHGLDRDSVGMAVVGAAVSLFAKCLWLGVMKHVHRDLSPEDEQWVAAQRSKAYATMAVASVRRQVARIEDRAAAELLALEASRRLPDGTLLGQSADVPEGVPAVSEVPAAQEVPAQVPPAVLTAPAASLPVPSEVPRADEPVLPEVAEAAPAPGTSGGTNRDERAEVPQADEPHTGPERDNAGPSRHLRPVRGTATAEIKALIHNGTTDPGIIRDRLAESGVKVPDSSYIRRLVREARNTTGPEGGTGAYL